MNTINNISTKNLLIAIAILAIAGVIWYFAGNATGRVNAPQIVGGVTSRSIDAQGNPADVTSNFSSKKDNVVYAFFLLKNATTNTTVGYTRFYNNKYVDSKVTRPSADSVSSVHFTFEKGIGKYPPGTYTIVAYLNGKRSGSLTYAFQ